MKILTVTFDYDGGDRYKRLTKVWKKSIEVNCPAAEITVIDIEPPKKVKRNFGLTSNWYKFKIWRDFVCAQPGGEHVILMDSDTLVLADLRVAFRESFDIGLTRRSGVAWPYNGGVVFVKCNERSKRFVTDWGEADDRMHSDEAFHRPYNNKYRGQNQASLGYMIENNTEAKILEFPCRVWNACNEDWMRFGDHTKVLHIKSQLRRYCLDEIPGRGMPSKMTEACKAFKRYEKLAEQEGEGWTGK